MILKKTDKWVQMMVPIYRTNIYVTGQDYKRSDFKDTRLVLSSISHSSPDIEGSCETCEHKGGAMALLIVLPRKFDESTLWHESIHAARAILDYVGIDDSAEDDENIPYLTEWIVKMIKHGFYGKTVDWSK